MPTFRRKRVMLVENADLIQTATRDPNKSVYYLHHTGELFETYEAYAARMSFYRLKQFQCEVTGKSGLDYFQALESERQEARSLHSKFSAQLKGPILKAVQWQVMGRLDHLVEAVFERFKDRYFKDEQVLVDLSGVKYVARVQKVYPPKYSNDAEARDKHQESLETDEEIPHEIIHDLKLPVKEVNAKDDPSLYYYWVHILGLERDKSRESKAMAAKAEKDQQMVGSLMEVSCGMLSRDRLSFSKSILRRFIRDCVDREATAASPWVVKPTIAQRFGVDTIMPEEIRKDVDALKKGDSDKRKKVWEDKDGPPSKKQKKMTPAQEERAKAAAEVIEKKEREAREKREEAEKLAVEKKKKKPIRYPTEDLDVRINDRDKKAGLILKRPPAERRGLPFNETPDAFESFVHSWNFLITYGQPLHLSTFTLDEFEHAIRHAHADIPCSLLAEVHSTLIYNLRTVPFLRHSAVLSLLREQEKLDEDPDAVPERIHGVSINELTDAIVEVGNNWERVPLRHGETREGWEDALMGCLKDHASIENFPKMRSIMTKLLFAPETTYEASSSAASTSSRAPSPINTTALTVRASPSERYPLLPPSDRVAILSFMCNIAVSSKAIHAHMESCEEQLTALRKERIELNRTRKQHAEDMASLLDQSKENSTSNDLNSAHSETPAEQSDVSGSEAASDSVSTSKKGSSKKSLQQKMQQSQHAKQREAARAKQASAKHAMAEHRRLDEEVNKLERRLEIIEREFRKLLGSVRVKPLGRDRFYNRIWWFDGVGAASLVGGGGTAQYGTGRLFMQGPSEFDLDILQRRKAEDPELEQRRIEEEGSEGMLAPGDWAGYSEVEELESFMTWLNPKGHRETALKTALTKWWPHITAGIKKRVTDLNANAKIPDARRSTRGKEPKNEVAREAYMQWTNRKAANTS